ncbi:MAG TPA: hypothetical protein DDE71_00950 [Tenacibaculum sp.]|nr:hypothetical protein [Tenacibaculum sp.]
MKNLRIDKNIAYNVLEFKKYQDRQTQIIIKSLLIYFSYSHQIDLFGYGVLDPHDFAKKMKIDKDSLFKKHPDPKQVKDTPLGAKKLYERQEVEGCFSTARVWDSYLENALYVLNTFPLYENFKGSTLDGKYIGIKNFILIREVQLHFKKTNKGRNTKIFYKYKLDEAFERNLRKFFLQTDFQKYLQFKKNNTEDFYLTVCNIYQTYRLKQINKYYWKFEDLLLLFNISSDLEAKYQKRKLNTIFKKFTGELSVQIKGLQFGWEKGKGQRWAYVPFVTWDQVDMSIVKYDDNKVLDDVFKKDLRRNLLEVFFNQNNRRDALGFLNWLLDNKVDHQLKVATYVSTYSMNKKVYKGAKPGTMAKQFFIKLASCQNEKEVREYF